jgi:transcriptional regulator with XRE-family HTH domain
MLYKFLETCIIFVQIIAAMEKQKLKQVRLHKGFTQQQVADALSTDISNYSRKENGHVRITKQEQKKLASILGVSEDEISQESEPMLNNTFFDSSSITNQNIGVPAAVLEHLYDYISLLKKENSRLKEELEKTKS